MGHGFRVFIVDDDDSLHRLSMTRFQRLLNSEPDECLRQYAGKQKRLAFVTLEVAKRKPLNTAILQKSCSWAVFL